MNMISTMGAMGIWVLTILAGCSAAQESDSSVASAGEELRGGRACDGRVGRACPNGEYCNEVAPGRCPGPKQVGVCAVRPQICNDLFAPVCGCDGKTYANACRAAAAGVAEAPTGACATACASNADCAATDFCEMPTGQCSGSGTCTARPQICPDIFQPVCGCDGRTYPNGCNASAAGVNVSSSGACPAKQLCGGIAGIACPGEGRCVDDPTDSCDPDAGGADCSGMCVCIETILCVQGTHFDSSPAVCTCVADAADGG